ncbi:zinc-dependent peptidase [Flavobacterium sp.]|uniref:zinc-dependent peptidase n=1 Tax=Flavobacterium sp. TaxID=239 RepID=UPI003527E014
MERVNLFFLLSGMVVLIVLLILIFQSIEFFYGILFNKPIFLHFYLSPKTLTKEQLKIVEEKISFYNSLSDKKKKYFEHRLATFIENYQFITKENLFLTDEIKVLISATAIKLTFGMRKYLIDVFDKIIVYPEPYYSVSNDAWHKGEFNPRMKAIVFSWKDFLEGYEYHNDNLNLGLHEFAHAVHFHGLKSNDKSAILFTRSYNRIVEYTTQPIVAKKLVNSNYFRIYAFTNSFEFIAVLLEHFFETPNEFKKEFPELFEKVRKMINFQSV